MNPEIGSQVVVTDRMINAALDGEVAGLLKRGFVERLIVDGARCGVVENAWNRDATEGAWELDAVAEELPEPTLEHLLVRADQQKMHLLASLLGVNELSWWRFLWLKITGKEIVRFDG